MVMKKTPSKAAKPNSARGKGGGVGSPTGAGTTASGPSRLVTPDNELSRHMAEQQGLAAAMPFNASKRAEYGRENAINPAEGTSTEGATIHIIT
jgi:hypothetical protein